MRPARADAPKVYFTLTRLERVLAASCAGSHRAANRFRGGSDRLAVIDTSDPEAAGLLDAIKTRLAIVTSIIPLHWTCSGESSRAGAVIMPGQVRAWDEARYLILRDAPSRKSGLRRRCLASVTYKDASYALPRDASDRARDAGPPRRFGGDRAGCPGCVHRRPVWDHDCDPHRPDTAQQIASDETS